ncbi:MAG TPA: DUF4127 family protein [Candidatus Baltobacteraceae bacterium]
MILARTAIVAIAAMLVCSIAASARPPGTPIVLVPLDDRPVTRQLPVLLGRIAGRTVLEPPGTSLGNYLQFGQPDAIVAWLNGASLRRANDYIVSTDMLAYGGLVASRAPGPSYADAYFRLNELAAIRRRQPHARIVAFATIMRLAPTGVPAIGTAAGFFASYPAWTYVQQYANLPDPIPPADAALAQQLVDKMGAPLLQAYLQTRARDYGVDVRALQMTQAGTIDRLALRQDDAGPVGLHVPEVVALQALVGRLGIGDRVSIAPGADEMGMVDVAAALARGAQWTPHVAVVYSTPSGAQVQDPLEFAPISSAIGDLIAACGGVRDDATPDLTLYVRVPNTGAMLDDAFLAALRTATMAGQSVALADLSFLEAQPTSQAAFAARLLGSGVASHLDAYSSWNTNANTVGTALAEAVAAGAGRRTGRYDLLAHREFTFDRILDDVGFHTVVRPDLNATLDAQGIADHTYLLPDVAAPISERNNALLWHQAQTILAQLYPDDHIAAMRITLPWNRTFETQIDVGLAPNL